MAIIVNSYPPRLGGLESHVIQLATELKSAGARVLVICLAEKASDTLEAGVRVIRLKMHFPIASVISFPAFGTTRRLSRLLVNEDINLVSTHTRFFPMSYVGLRAAASRRIPVIHTEHGAGFVKNPSNMIQMFSRLVDLTFGRFVLRGAAQVLAVSEQSAQFVSYLAGIDARVFPNALQMENWPRSGDSPTLNGIAFLGRLVPGKGWETVIDVAAELIKVRGFDDLVVHILGDGPDADAVIARVRLRGIEQSVQIHGHAQLEEVRDALRRSVLVNPSELAEGFQVTLLEAVAAGAQIVSYPVPSVPPLLADGGPVRLVSRESFDNLVDSVQDALRNPMPPMSRAVLEARWSWRIRSREYLALARRVTTPRQ
ncbi:MULTISPECIES: glycosyltransferase family 4 protein [unclassified Cryobacterium]|uniref:glycosyltransferase family 4 protein n=1 Tax=unclassified Cryobacterium TaxID=2649013 RepID=UPI00141B1285|nr:MULTISPECIES: glycosyltransferase family 4 protein [unclassified Cryobacterium]